VRAGGMAQDVFHYDKMVERALRGVIHDALARAAREGLKSAHHFFIAFATTAPGVKVPPRLLERYPAEITIVLQHQFWDLDVGDESFSVSLSFDKQVERLTVPFVAIKSFADPSVEFALAFSGPAPAPVNEAALPAVVEGKTTKPPKGDGEKGQVVALDSFRKR
jgi:hypothetical protein